MAKEGEARVIGYDELAAGSKTLFQHLAEEAPKAFLEVARAGASSVQAAVPRLSGRLAGSVTTTQEGDHASVGIGEGVPYAGWIEFGGSRGRPYMAEGRYLFPITLAAEPAVVTAGEQAAEKEIKEARWPNPR